MSTQRTGPGSSISREDAGRKYLDRSIELPAAQREAFLASLPPLPLTKPEGQALRLADFAGQKLVLLICPPDKNAALREICEYQARMADFEDAGAWVLGVIPSADLAATGSDPTGIHLCVDPDGTVLEKLAGAAGFAPPPRLGAVFVIDRCGTLRAAWTGGGHVGDALLQVEERP